MNCIFCVLVEFTTANKFEICRSSRKGEWWRMWEEELEKGRIWTGRKNYILIFLWRVWHEKRYFV